MSANADPDAPSAKSWQWSEVTWRGYVNRIRAGSHRQMDWPTGTRMAVAISFDADHETIPLRDGEVSPGSLAQGEYGSRVGAPRILALLGERQIHATFFMPAVSALLHPEEALGYVEHGHEVGVHGWIHERNVLLLESEERELMERSVAALQRITGIRPVGLRTPSWDFSEHTLAVARALGFAYDSSLMADDDPYELIADGEPTGVIEIPVDWIRDDAPYFSMDRYGSERPYTPPRDVLTIWQDEFDAAWATGGVFQLTLHPHIIGHRSRLVALRGLLDHIQSHDGIWFATHAQIAAHLSMSWGIGDR